MHSCIYEGKVRHHRFEPVEHRFTYRLFMMYLDLDELTTVFDGYRLWSASAPNVAWFRPRDHLGSPGENPADSVRKLVREKTGRTLAGPVRLLTHLRYFGFAMNPVSFYYCFDPSDTHVQCIVAEVNNTPWGERHCYVIENPQQTGSKSPRQKWTQKEFHVSPFMPMEMWYRWHLSHPGESLNIHIENHRHADHSHSGRSFSVTMAMKRRPITSRSMAHVLCSYPLMTARVFAAIYWQAVRLWWKRTPFIAHPGKVAEFRPRSKNTHPCETSPDVPPLI